MLITDSQILERGDPGSYDIDGMAGIGNPSHMFGHRLKAFLNVVTISRTAKRNLVFYQKSFEYFRYYSFCIAASACITRDQAIDGAVLIDIDDKNTDIAIYLEGKMHYMLNSNWRILITRDIQQLLTYL